MNFSAPGSLKQSPYYAMAIKLGVASVIFFTVLGFYFFYWSPTLDMQEVQIDEMEDAKVELHQVEAEILALEQELGKLNSKQEENSTRFFVGSELIQLNRLINEFATQSNVRILSMEIQQKSKLQKSGEEAGGADMMMDDDGSGMMDDGGSGMMDDGGSNGMERYDYFAIPIGFKVQGGYLDYLTFRSQLAGWSKAININSETVTAGHGRYKGVVTVVGTLQVVQKMKAKGKF